MVKRKGGKKPPQGRKIMPTTSVSVAKPSWDMGASGPANRRGLQTEEAGTLDPITGEMVNPNLVLRVRRVDLLETWMRRGEISPAGFAAAEVLRNALEATQKTPGWLDNDRVQSSPKPDHAVTIQTDRISAFNEAMRSVEPQDRGIIDCCVLSGHSPGQYKARDGKHPFRNIEFLLGMKWLREALDRVAANMARQK